jgi:hypothetical protein
MKDVVYSDYINARWFFSPSRNFEYRQYRVVRMKLPGSHYITIHTIPLQCYARRSYRYTRTTAVTTSGINIVYAIVFRAGVSACAFKQANDLVNDDVTTLVIKLVISVIEIDLLETGIDGKRNSTFLVKKFPTPALSTIFDRIIRQTRAIGTRYTFIILTTYLWISMFIRCAHVGQHIIIRFDSKLWKSTAASYLLAAADQTYIRTICPTRNKFATVLREKLRTAAAR